MIKTKSTTFNNTHKYKTGNYVFTWNSRTEDNETKRLQASILSLLRKRLEVNKLEKAYLLEHMAYLREKKKVHK